MRELKKDEFGEFLRLIEQREPEIKELLNTANDIVNAAFYNPAPYRALGTSHSPYLPPSSSTGLNLSRGIAPALPANDNEPVGHSMEDLLSQSIRSGIE